MKRLFHSLPWKILAVAAASPCIMQASSDRSNQEVVFLNADVTSFWRTATNRVIKVPVDMPVLATSARLTVAGAKYFREYSLSSSGDFEVELPVADSFNAENVYDLTLAFNDGTVRRAKLGLVQGYSDSGGEGASTRVLAPKGDAKWNVVKKRVVMPVPYGTTSLSVNGVEIEDAAANAQGWYALSGSSGDAVTVSLQESGTLHEVSLAVYGLGHFVIIR